MINKWLVFGASVTTVIFLTTCSMPRSGGTPVYPTCDPAHMIAPSLVYPAAGGTISNLEPLFEWASPGFTPDPENPGGQILCTTDHFNVYLSSGPFYQDSLGGQADGMPGFDSLYTRTWTPGTPLEPGRVYRWSVRPVSQGVEGPASEVHTFFTGPACDAQSLSVPIPLSPLNHWVVDDLSELELAWWYPGDCLPDSFNVEISPIMQFAGSPLNDNTSTPVNSWVPTHLLEDCNRYFWKVTAVKDGEPAGQGSQVLTFKVDLAGTCPAESVGYIQGTLWEDQCAGIGPGTPVPDPLPLGCVLTSGNTLFPNQTYDPGEPGIPGAVVSLGTGACPSSGLRDVPTWQDGMYDFYMLNPGTYCVSIDLGYAWNNFLLPGGWTVPASAVGDSHASQTVTVEAGQVLRGVDFGWWYQYGTSWGSTNASVFGMVWHDQCAYSPGDPVPDPLPEGCALDAWRVVYADAVRQAGEPGIPAVTVDIGPGDCPSSGLATSLTDASGYYHFNDLPAGKYCLRIDPGHGSPNQAILLPGSWTLIPSGHDGMTFRAITLAANHTLAGQDFGWDYDLLPLAATATPVATPTDTPTPVPLGFIPNFNANCLYGPNLTFPSIGVAMAGQFYLLDGRNLDSSWYRIMLTGAKGCWLPASAGKPSGATANLRVLNEVPTFTPTRLPTDTPTPTPTLVVDCSRYLDEKSCELQPTCAWYTPATTAPYCGPK